MLSVNSLGYQSLGAQTADDALLRAPIRCASSWLQQTTLTGYSRKFTRRRPYSAAFLLRIFSLGSWFLMPCNAKKNGGSCGLFKIGSQELGGSFRRFGDGAPEIADEAPGQHLFFVCTAPHPSGYV